METIRPIFSDDRGERLEHYGVLGMKWGVRNAETLRKYAGAGSARRQAKRADRAEKLEAKSRDAKTPEKAERLQKKAEYLKELNEPGSTKIDEKTLRSKRVKNAILTGAAAYEAVSDTLGSAYIATLLPSASALGPTAPAVLGTALVTRVLVGSAAAKVGYDAYGRAKAVNTSLKKRK